MRTREVEYLQRPHFGPSVTGAAAVVVTAAAGIVVGLAAGHSRAAVRVEVRSPVVAFEPAAGWSVINSRVPAGQQQNIDIAWATNSTIRGTDVLTTWPTDTAKHLSGDEIVVYASFAKQVDDPGGYHDRHLPLDLTDGYFLSTNYENQPARNVSVYTISAHTDAGYLLIYVWFGRNTPDQLALANADAELHRVVVPAAAS
jgi:hypothetical protein